MSKPIFFDPDRRRWKRIRKSIDITVVVLSLLIVFFALTVVRKTNIPTVLLADQKKNYRALKLNEPKKPLRKGDSPQDADPGLAGRAELRRRDSRRVLCDLGCGQLQFAA